MAVPNKLFAIINLSDAARVRVIMPSLAPWVSSEVQDGQWLLVAPSGTTTQEVSTKLGFNQTGPDTAIILSVDNYHGRNYDAVWEWIKTKLGAELGTPTPA
jgi:hypothetical protein